MKIPAGTYQRRKLLAAAEKHSRFFINMVIDNLCNKESDEMERQAVEFVRAL